nr:hypothetical protein [uncultured Macellibacteroides sp.]
MKQVYIKAISSFLPEKVVTNEDLICEFPEWTVEKVASKLGINSRHIAAENETAGDMAENSCSKSFSRVEHRSEVY